jgi:ribonuclease HII
MTGAADKGRGMGLAGGQQQSADLFSYERAARVRDGVLLVAGVDEAGRGPLAGPVVAAAVILPADGFSLPVRDSKALREGVREELAVALRADARVRYAVSVKSAARIDEINILRATHEAMREAARALQPSPELVLVDGLRVPDFPYPAQFVIKGDALSASIAAASIIAKTHRDQLMLEYDREYPEYGFARHKGYGTAEHLAALAAWGPCPIHRRTFAPVAQILRPPAEQLSLSFSANGPVSSADGYTR